MKQLCNFAILRFMPFAETQEFANVGIMLYAPKTGFVDYLIAPKSFKRVTQFFDDLEGGLYKNAMTTFEKELARVKNYGLSITGEKQVKFFEEVTRFREGIIFFSESQAMLHENPKIALEELFRVYVARNFVTKEYREQQMVKALRHDLKKYIPDVHFTQQKLQAGKGVQIDMPFVSKRGLATKVIKPLSFNQTKPLALIEHGEQWINRVKRLIRSDTVQAKNMLFAVEKPRIDKVEILDAYTEVASEMASLETNLTMFEDRKSIFKFASDIDEEEFKLA